MEAFEYDVMAAVEHRHWWYSGMRAIAASWLDNLLLDRSGLCILDAGCGTGANGEFLRRYGTTVGIDLSAQATQLAARRIGGAVGRASVVALPFQTNSFDLVTSFEVLYHRGVIDVPQALREVDRVLRPGGYLLLRLPAFQWLWSQHDRSVHARERYTTGQVRALLDEAGMEVVQLSYCNTVLFPLVVARRLLEPLVPQAEDGSALVPPSRLVNTTFRMAMEFEAAWLGRGGALPWGLSVLALGRTPT